MLLREHREASARYAEATAAAAQAAATQNAILESLAALQAKEILQAAFQFQGRGQMQAGNDPMLSRLPEPSPAQVADTASLSMDRLLPNDLDILSRLLAGSMSSSAHLGSTVTPVGLNVSLPTAGAVRTLGTPSTNLAANANASLPSEMYRVLGSQTLGNSSLEPFGTRASSSQSPDDVTSLLLALLQAPETSRPQRNHQLPQQQPMLPQELLQLLAAAPNAPSTQVSSSTVTRALPGAFPPPGSCGRFQSPSSQPKQNM
jgi:hypothetical protein